MQKLSHEYAAQMLRNNFTNDWLKLCKLLKKDMAQIKASQHDYHKHTIKCIRMRL